MYNFIVRSFLFTVVASLLDLMVPNHIRPARKKKKPVPDLDWEDQAIVTCASIVLENLKKRYFWMFAFMHEICTITVYCLTSNKKVIIGDH